MPTWYVDYEGGNNGNAGNSFAQRWKTINNVTAANGVVAGDTARVMGAPAPTSLGQNLTWTHLSKTVTLSAALTQMIADCETNWTASASVTCTSNTSDFKEGTKSQQIAVAAGFTTGLAAYFPTGTLDLSAYKQVTFWVRQTNGTAIAAAAVSICLCSDAVGAVPVNTINVPAIGSSPFWGWVPVTVDTGGALGSAIQSVALYINTDSGAQTFLIDNVSAAKDSTSADSLTLTSLLGTSDSIGAGGSDGETFYGIQSINGTTVKLDNGTNTLGSAGKGWSGQVRTIQSSTNTSPIQVTSAGHGLVTGDVIELRGHYLSGSATLSNATGASLTVTVIDANTFSINSSTGNGVGSATGGFWTTTMVRTGYKQETIKTTIAVATAQTVSVSGAAGSPVTFSGGWDRTAMTTQNLYTWFDAQTSQNSGDGLDFASVSYVSMSRIGFVRGNNGVKGTAPTNLVLTIPGTNNCNSTAFNIGSTGKAHTLTLSAVNNNTGGSVASTGYGSTVTVGMASNCLNGGGIGLTVYSTLVAGSVCNNGSNGITGGAWTSFVVNGCVANTFAGIANLSYAPAISVCSIAAYNGTVGVNFNLTNAKLSIITYGNTTAGVTAGGYGNILYRSASAEGTPVSGPTALSGGRLLSFDDQAVAGAFKIYDDNATVQRDTTTVYVAGGASWKLSPTSADHTAAAPVSLRVARIAVTASVTYTVTAWVRRDDTGITAKLVCRGYQVTGVTADVTATAVASANTWEQLSIAFTPTENGVVGLDFLAYGGTTLNTWIDEINVNGVRVSLDYSDPLFGPGPDPFGPVGVMNSSGMTGGFAY